jgi:flagellar hook-associated protein 2
MAIQALGVGSGLDLESLVGQLIAAEREPKVARFDKKEESLDAEVSGLGKLKSKMKDFQDSVDKLRSDTNLQGREPSIKNPSENVEPFTAEASKSAVEADYEVAVTQLASGSRIESNDASSGNGFSATTDPVLTGSAGSLTFEIGATSDSFSINVTDGMTLQQLSSAINASEDNFGVKASIIDTGTADGGAKLVYTSTTTGTGNDLVVRNDNDLADLERVATTNSDSSATYLTPVKSAQNAKATVDGIDVESTTNEFKNVIENVTFKASKISEFADDGVTPLSSTLTIGFDSEGLESKIRDFVDNYNTLNSELTALTQYGKSDLEDDGAFAGDYMVRAIEQGMSNIISSAVSTSALGGLFQLGIEFNDKNELEIGSSDKYGFGSGEDRLKDALENNFDDISALFADPDKGVAERLYSYVKQYTDNSGVLNARESSIKDQQTQLGTEREQFEMRIAITEQILRDKYLNLDQTVAKLNQTGSALLAALG